MPYHVRPFSYLAVNMARACGLDFGTSNSTLGWHQPGKPALLPLEDGKTTLPSAVFFDVDEDVVVYGRQALAHYLAGNEGRLMRSLKSLLGSSLIDGQTEVQGRAISFRALLSFFVGELKKRGERAAGRGFEHAVLGRPVFFVDDDEKADRQAQQTLEEIARAAGFKELAFQYEPIAAAFDYESQISREELVLIVDIGGGTSDFSLVRLSPERAKQVERREDILATGGVHIGGTDFDKYLSLASVMPLLGLGTQMKNGTEVPSSYYFNLATWHTINQAYTQRVWTQLKDVQRDAAERDKLTRLMELIEDRAGHWLAIQVEEAKIGLSQAETVQMHLDRLRPPYTLELAQSQFEGAIAHLVTRVGSTVQQLLSNAGVPAERIDTVFFTGGSSGVRMLREQVTALLPNARSVEGDLFGSIGAGLALDAWRKFG